MNKKFVTMAGIAFCVMLTACGTKENPDTGISQEVITESVENGNDASADTVITPEKREEEFSVSEDLASVRLGKYEQNNITQNGTEPIEWIVLETSDNMALVISKNILDCQPYNKDYTDCTWESSSIRKWLNSDFYNTAFSESEQQRIVKTFVPDVNPELTQEVDISSQGSGESGDNATDGSDTENSGEQTGENEITGTEDYIFLLSDFELQKYLADDENVEGDEAYATVTAYARAQGVWTMTEELYKTRKDEDIKPESVGCGWWWLRTGSETQTKALDVDSSGNIRVNGHDIVETHDGVRPAMWITLD